MIGRILLIGFMVGVITPTLIQRTGRTDLQILDLAAHRLMAAEPVYRLEDTNEHTKPPLATLAFIPFSQIPLFALCRLWDLLNLTGYFLLLQLLLRKMGLPEARKRDWALFATFFLLTPLNSELRLGQYNLLLLLAVLGSVLGGKPFWAGVAACFAFLFKPTFVLLFPWVFFQVSGRTRFMGGVLGTALSLAAVYSVVFGPSALIADWTAWSAFLPLSSTKHLLRWDNHGFPSAFAAFSGVSAEKPLGIFAMVLCAWAAWKSRDPFQSLSIACACMVFFSPMAWLQNFTLLLPAVFWVLKRRAASLSTQQVFYSLALVILWLGIGALNPTTSHWLQADRWPFQRIPLWVLLAATALITAAEFKRKYAKRLNVGR